MRRTDRSRHIHLLLSLFLLMLFSSPTAQLSYGQAPTGEANGASNFPSISADGRYVAFESVANNLVEGDTNGFTDIFVHDRKTGTTTLVSKGFDGIPANNQSVRPSISADGLYVAFFSYASNLVVGDTNDVSDVFVYSMQTGTTSRASIADDGSQADGASSIHGAPVGYANVISVDGRYVVFTSSATNLVPGGTNGSAGVFVHDMQTGQTLLVSVAYDGTPASDSGDGSISGDGRLVVFSSLDIHVVPNDSNQTGDVFLRDIQTNQTERISVASDSSQANGGSAFPAISADGRYVAFQSGASNLSDDDTNNRSDVFVRDRQTNQTHRISTALDLNAYSASGNPAISADGRFVAYYSSENPLVNPDPDSGIFVYDQENGGTTRVSV